MLRHERLSAIVEFVSTHESVSVDQLAEELNVSTATIRRDLDELAEQQLIVRTHGGATSPPFSFDLPMRYRTAAGHGKAKWRIAKEAVTRAHAGAIIGLNGGTTTTEVARELALNDDLFGTIEHPLTIMTNAVNIANELAVRSRLRVVLTGGIVRSNSFELIGPLADPVLNQISVDLFFLGVEAIDAEGVYTRDDAEAAINSAIAQRARKTIVVADATKFNTKAFIRICSLDDIDEVITDNAPDSELSGALADHGVTVCIAPES